MGSSTVTDMANCEYCKGVNADKSGCPNCGRYLRRFDEVQIISGTNSATEIARLSMTDKYMMIHRTSGGEKTIAASFGLIGSLAASALSSGTLYGFYDLKEMEKVIFPYHNKKFKKNNALKIVNKDGSDLIIKSVIGAVGMDKIAECFAACGVFVQDGTNMDFGKDFCVRPFVDKKTMGSRICPSAVPFVKPVRGNFYAESVSGVLNTAPKSAPVEVKVAEEPKPISVETVPAHKEETVTEPTFKFCYNCGKRLDIDDMFCSGCGKKQ